VFLHGELSWPTKPCWYVQRQAASAGEMVKEKKSWTRERRYVLMRPMLSIPKIPDIPEEERTPLVVTLLEIIQLEQEQIQALKDEIARLKGHKPRPEIKPSKLEQDSKDDKNKDNKGRLDSAGKNERGPIEIHETKILEAENVPPGSRLKGYEDYTVQGLVIKPYNVLYRRQRWQTPQGDWIVAPLPPEVQALGGHFNKTIVAFILYQYYHAHVTEPLILEELREFGIRICSGEVSHIITEGHERFHEEKQEILRVGLEVSAYINVDDTGARHQGKNGFCTHIGNELFAWFQSTGSKSRMNFLELLRAGQEDYVLTPEALQYMRVNGLPKAQLEILAEQGQKSFADEAHWKAALFSLGITCERHIRIATEGALLGSALEHGINPELVVLSDDAGQFNVLLHALCWLHAERTIHKMVGFNDKQREALEEIRTGIWDLYRDLKAYRAAPSAQEKVALQRRFDELFSTQSCFATLNQALRRLYNNKAELLVVLERPEVPLHNNTSERDIREYVKKRKISGSTRSDLGRRCRDTFTSLKKTCRKLGISFWQFLKDRLCGTGKIAPLSEHIRRRAMELDSS